MSTLAGIASQFLDPFQVYDRHHANQQIDMPGHVLLWGDDAAVQSFIKQDIRRFRQRLPGRESPWHLVPRYGLIVSVQIFSRLAFARLTVFDESLFQQTEVIRFGPK